MRESHRVKITTVRRLRVRLEPAAIRAHCAVCGREVETLTAAQAAEVLEVDDQILARLAAEGLVHVIQTVSGSRRVCQDSLFPTGGGKPGLLPP